MPTSKNRRKKRRSEKPCRAHPSIYGYLWGEEVEKESLLIADEIANQAIDLIRMRSSDPDPYADMLSVLRNIYVGSALFENKEDVQNLAILCRALLDVIYMDSVEGRRAIPEEDMPSLIRPFTVALETSHAIYENLTRSEVIHLDRIGEDFLVRAPNFQVWLLQAPDENEIKAIVGRSGIAFLRDTALRGRIEVRDGACFWLTPDDRLIRIVDNTPVILHKHEEKS